MMFFRFEDERIVEAWEVTDEFSQREQLIADND
jgi:predicted ester cyclase